MQNSSSLLAPRSEADTVLQSAGAVLYKYAFPLSPRKRVMKKDSILLIKISPRKNVKDLGEPIIVCTLGNEHTKK